MKNYRWAMVIVGLIALLMVGSMVWASPPPSGPSIPPQATVGLDADMVDGFHAASSSAGAATRAGKLVNVGTNGRFPLGVMPTGNLDNRYVNDDQQETISAAVADTLLTVNNTGQGFGLRAIGYDPSSSDRYGDLLLGGTRGEITTFGSVMNLLSDGNVQVYLDDDDNYADAWFGIWNGDDNSAFKVYEDGDMVASGTKNALVQTEDYGQRLLYAMESTEVWFEDFGTASLVEGVAKVAIEPIFAQTVNLSEYHVFLTPLSDEPVLLFITEKKPAGFTVRGVTLDGQGGEVSFDYRIVAKRLGYEDVRMESVAADTLTKR